MNQYTSQAWTPERTALLFKIYHQGPTAIVAALNDLPGPTLTKNMVIGKHNRIFGPKNPVKTQEEKDAARSASRELDRIRKQIARARLGTGAKVQKIRSKKSGGPRLVKDGFKPRIADVVSRRVPLLQLMAMECRWADEERDAEGRHTFCGNATDGSSYCTAHAAINVGSGTASERAADRNLIKIADREAA